MIWGLIVDGFGMIWLLDFFLGLYHIVEPGRLMNAMDLVSRPECPQQQASLAQQASFCPPDVPLLKNNVKYYTSFIC